MRWKWTLIIGLTVLSIWRSLPLEKQIRLGLDLKGGVHLVLRVVTEDAVRSELDDAVNRLRLRLEDKKIPVASIERVMNPDQDVFRVVVKGIGAGETERARKVVESALPGYRIAPSGDQVDGSLPAQRVAEIRELAVEQARNTIEERINATGVVDPLIQRQGMNSDRILIQLPGASDPEHVKQLIGQVAFLELKLVESSAATREDLLARHQGSMPSHLEIVEGSDEDGNIIFYALDRIPVVTGRDLSGAIGQRDELGQPAVGFRLNVEGARKFGEATGKNIGKQLAIVLDNRVKSAPSIRSRISDSGQITGGYTAEEARNLALVLRSGALPAQIQYLEERTVGATLGTDSIRKGVTAGAFGLVMIVVAMLIYYRLSGLNALVALALNGILLLGAMALLKATLTLPGIAGYILTLGMAVDANVLIFEAIREAIRAGVPPKDAIEKGFERSFTTIIDTHLTTMLAAGALWMLGSGPVRGFGVTLLIGLLISLFTAYFVSKTIYDTFVLSRPFKPGESVSI